MDPFLPFVAIFCILLAFLIRTRGSWRNQRLPPGPPTKFLVGNILQVPGRGAWHFFTECKEVYGDLVFFHGLGKKILVVNSLQSVNELFDKKWNIYSHRPTFTAVGELMGVNKASSLMRYGEEWREHRKIQNMILSASAARRWHTIQETISTFLLRDLLDDPDNFFGHVKLAAARIVLYVGYGLFPETMDDPYVILNEKKMDIIAEGMVPGAFLCDMFPILKYSPSWVPFQRRIAMSRKIIHGINTSVYRDVQKQVEQGTALPSLVKDLISSGKYTDPALEDRAIWSASAIYGAGFETTYTITLTFILSMALYPDTQKRAQAEIDQVLGERMPTIADMSQLPYTRALIKEVLRWNPPVPLSLPRCTEQEDVYQGYYIPKGTVVMPNVWAISRDTSNPEPFDPDRFMDPNNAPVDPSEYAFGFGRRICPGRYLADNSLSAFIPGLLWAFDISQLPGQTLEPRFVPKVASCPDRFQCTIKARSAVKAEMIRNRAADVSLE